MSTLPLVAPRGLRDLLPEATATLSALQRKVLGAFERAGYGRVTTPAFEYADVLERGLEVDRSEVVRFVEPDSGEVALLRPDMTPQVARIVATRLADRPAPYRLSYQGTVIRRRDGRARRSRMAVHAGVECIGIAGPEGDLEVMELACESLRLAGLRSFRVELGQVAIAKHQLAALPEAMRAAAMEALAQKDAATLARVAKDAGLSAKAQKDLVALASLYGGREVLAKARRRFPAHREELDRLAQAYDALRSWTDRHEGASVGIDLGELRGHGYYTGLSFSLLAAGPGANLGGGGRYDDLVGRFGRDLPATGFGIDLDRLQWALDFAGVAVPVVGPLRILLSGDEDPGPLRHHGVVVARHASPSTALAYARAWSFDLMIKNNTMTRCSDGATKRLSANWTEDVVAHVLANKTWARASEE